MRTDNADPDEVTVMVMVIRLMVVLMLNDLCCNYYLKKTQFRITTRPSQTIAVLSRRNPRPLEASLIRRSTALQRVDAARRMGHL